MFRFVCTCSILTGSKMTNDNIFLRTIITAETVVIVVVVAELAWNIFWVLR